MDETRIILHGIRIDHKLQIAEGITLMPLPNSSEDPIPISPGLPTIIMKEPKSYLGRVLLRKAKSKEFPVATFLHHLSLICNNAVHPVKEWLQSNTSDPFRHSYRFPPIVHSYRDDPRWHLENPFNRIIISRSHISAAEKQLHKFTKLNGGVKKKLEIAIPRWVKSKTELNSINRKPNIINRIIDLAIAFEVLYSNESREQLSLTFRLRAAWHLGGDVQERQRLHSFFKDIYDARSEAVHGGKLSKKSSAKVNEEKLAEADKWFAQAIKKFIDDGNFPDWDSLVLGETRKRGLKDK